MCGIAGVISHRHWSKAATLVEQITRHQVPRGPDVRAVDPINDDLPHVVFGHNRLSIVDLSPASNQPMWDTVEDLCIVFNGEIYNFIELRAELEARGYRFRTRGDTEVILAAYDCWGTDAFQKLFGMFAFALFDRRNSCILLVRDRFGVKPLMYHQNGSILAFASSSLALADLFGLAPRMDYVMRGVRFRIYDDETTHTAFERLRAVAPGTFVKIRINANHLDVAEHRYYDFHSSAQATAEAIAGWDDRRAFRHLEDLISDAVRIRLRADVEMGISLSGGVDSSLIACLCADAGARLRAFSFGDPTDRTSEAPLIELLNRQLGLQVQFISLRTRDEVAEAFWRTMAAQEAPFAGPSLLAQNAVFRCARDECVRVLLGGQGGDEAFMGYRKFFLFYAQDILRRRAMSQVPRLLATLAPLPLANLTKARILWSDKGRYLSAKRRESRLSMPEEPSTFGLGLAPQMTLFERQALDVTRFSLPTLLRYEDRNSAANSIETRLPFIDHRVLEFGVALPTTSKLRRGQGKWILRSMLARRTSADIAWSRVKRGFDVNERRLIDLGLGALLRSAIKARRSLLEPILNMKFDVEQAYSDERLLDNHIDFAEAVSLIWLADRMEVSGTDMELSRPAESTVLN